MESDEKHILLRILNSVTGILAVATLVIFASAAGVNAYLAFQPSALEARAAQAITPQPATAPISQSSTVFVFPASSTNSIASSTGN